MSEKIDVAEAMETSEGMLQAFGPQYVNLARHHQALVEALEHILGCEGFRRGYEVGHHEDCPECQSHRELLPTTPRAEEE